LLRLEAPRAQRGEERSPGESASEGQGRERKRKRKWRGGDARPHAERTVRGAGGRAGAAKHREKGQGLWGVRGEV